MTTNTEQIQVPTNYHSLPRRDVAKLITFNYSRVLDIGCGIGAFRQNLKSNCEYWGIEPTDAAKQSKFIADKVYQDIYENIHIQLPNEYFDLVICNDVIEHMPDHDNFLELIREKLTPDGRVIGSIPNVRHYKNLINLLFKKDWEYQPSGLLDKTHLRFFTYKSLQRCFLSHNYQVELLHYKSSSITRQFRRKTPLAWWKIVPFYVRGAWRASIPSLIVLLSLGFFYDTQFSGFLFYLKKTLKTNNFEQLFAS